MRRITIHTQKNHYQAGDTIEGFIVVECDEEFKYNAIHLTMTGEERTRVVIGSGKHRRVYRDKREFVSERIDYDEMGIMPVGEKQFQFSFSIPENAPSSYSGRKGWIAYDLQAVVEISWAGDPEEKFSFQVLGTVENLEPKSQQSCAEKDEISVLEVELPQDVICLGGDIEIKFRVDREVKIRKVRFEIITEEFVTARGRTNRSTYKLLKHEIEEQDIMRSSWTEITLRTDETMPPSISRELLKLTTILKVTLDIPLALDKSIEIPFTVGHCLKGSPIQEQADSDDWFS
ncbi:MAG: hypothetical protein ACTSV2_14960 [Candidatus Thorarchaeota archaeon]